MNPLYILAFSLFIIPLCGPIIIEPIISIRDLWTTKEFLVLISILAIVASGKSLTSQSSDCNPNKNIFLIALLLFLPISTFSAPPLNLIYGHENMAGLWIWRGLAWCFAYFLLYKKISETSINSTRRQMVITKCIGWAAIISAGYAYLQVIGLDQWQIKRPPEELKLILVPNITAVIGNPTYLATWLVMCLPFLCLFFRWYWTTFVIGAIFLCKSDIGMAGISIIMVIVACMRARSTIWLKIMAGVAIAICLSMWANWETIRPKIHDNGRFGVWAQTFEDWKGPCITLAITENMSKAQKVEIEKLNKRTYSFTGRGLGSFPYIFSPKYGTRYESAHNEYLEGLYSIGLIGMVLFLGSVGFVFYHSFNIARTDIFCLAVYASFFYSCIAAVGLPILHIEPLRYFSAVMFCLLSNFISRR